MFCSFSNLWRRFPMQATRRKHRGTRRSILTRRGQCQIIAGALDFSAGFEFAQSIVNVRVDLAFRGGGVAEVMTGRRNTLCPKATDAPADAPRDDQPDLDQNSGSAYLREVLRRLVLEDISARTATRPERNRPDGNTIVTRNRSA